MESTTQQPDAKPALYAQKEITQRGGFSKSHLYNLLARREFPQPVVRSGPRFTRWASASVDAWMADPVAWIAANAAAQK